MGRTLITLLFIAVYCTELPLSYCLLLFIAQVYFEQECTYHEIAVVHVLLILNVCVFTYI